MPFPTTQGPYCYLLLSWHRIGPLSISFLNYSLCKLHEHFCSGAECSASYNTWKLLMSVEWVQSMPCWATGFAAAFFQARSDMMKNLWIFTEVLDFRINMIRGFMPYTHSYLDVKISFAILSFSLHLQVLLVIISPQSLENNIIYYTKSCPATWNAWIIYPNINQFAKQEKI